jgi:hypothetical protein
VDVLRWWEKEEGEGSFFSLLLFEWEAAIGQGTTDASWAGREAEAQWGEGERPDEKKQVGHGWAGWPLGRLGRK